MMSNVLKEREAQLEYKEKLGELHQQKEDEERRNYLETFENENQRIRREELGRLEQRRQIAEFQKSQVHDRQEKERLEKEVNMSIFNFINKDSTSNPKGRNRLLQ
jgi:hypothetical protein